MKMTTIPYQTHLQQPVRNESSYVYISYAHQIISVHVKDANSIPIAV